MGWLKLMAEKPIIHGMSTRQKFFLGLLASATTAFLFLIQGYAGFHLQDEGYVLKG